MLENPEDVLDKGLHGRAALFVETGDLFVNGLYEAIERTVADIEPEFAGQAESETVRTLITAAARLGDGLPSGQGDRLRSREARQCGLGRDGYG